MKHDSGTRRMSGAEARAMYQRTLNGWVMDTLRLGRRGLERPSARAGIGKSGARAGMFSLRPSGARKAG